MHHLQNHPDRYYCQSIFGIIQSGARIGYMGPDQHILSENLSSATEDPTTLTKDLEKQIANDRVTPIATPWKSFISSPLGLVPKPDGGWRRIHHLSFPKGLSVNCHIPEEWGSLEYTTFDKAIEAVLRCGPGAVMIKKDLADAFRHIPVAEADWWLLGFYWKGSYWIDRFLPFGLRTSPMIFDLFAKGLHWILLNLG